MMVVVTKLVLRAGMILYLYTQKVLILVSDVIIFYLPIIIISLE